MITKDIVMGVLIGLILVVGTTTGVVYVVDGYTPLVTRLCLVGFILGIVGYATATWE